MPDAAPITDPSAGNQPASTPVSTGGSTSDFLTQLPEEFRADPVFSSFKESGLAGLAKSYKHASSMVGADKIVLPGKDAKPEEWAALWSRLGRPEKPDAYEFPAPKEGSGFAHDPEMIAGFREVAHKIGLTNKQVAEVMGWYNGVGETFHGKLATDAQAFVKTATDTLRQKWGNAFDKRVDLAETALQDFGGPELVAVFKQTGLNNHPAVIEFLADIGEAMVEDTLPGTATRNFGHTPDAANKEIGDLSLNAEFMKAYLDADHPGHKEAVSRMERLHKDAHPELRAA